MYINNELLKEEIGLYRIKQFISNSNLEYDTYITVLKIKCTDKQYDKIINMLVHY